MPSTKSRNNLLIHSRYQTSLVALDVCWLSCWQMKGCPISYWCICMKTQYYTSVFIMLLLSAVRSLINTSGPVVLATKAITEPAPCLIDEMVFWVMSGFFFFLHTSSVHWTLSQNLSDFCLFLCGFVNYNLLFLKPNKDFYLEVMVLIFSHSLTRKHVPTPWRALFSCCAVVKVIFFTMQMSYFSSTPLVCLVLVGHCHFLAF